MSHLCVGITVILKEHSDIVTMKLLLKFYTSYMLVADKPALDTPRESGEEGTKRRGGMSQTLS